MAIETRPLTSRFGVEIAGIDLAHPDPADVKQAERLWYDNGVVLFREQNLSEADVVRFSRHFGELEIHVREEYLDPEHPELLTVSNVKRDGGAIGILGDHEVGWHHDQIYQLEPAVGSLLCAFKIPPTGGETCFANLAVAYEALPDAKKEMLASLKAVQSYAYFNRQWSEPTNEQQTARTPDVVHPLVRTHPVTGRKAIYVDPAMTAAIDGVFEDESREILDELFDWIQRPEFVYEHSWRLGDAVMWDNASTMHRRGDFDPAAERIMKRTTIMPPPERAVPF